MFFHKVILLIFFGTLFYLCIDIQYHCKTEFVMLFGFMMYYLYKKKEYKKYIDTNVLICCCGNKDKCNEINNTIRSYNDMNHTQFNCIFVDIDVEEIQHLSPKKVAEQKVIDLHNKFSKIKDKLKLNGKHILKNVNIDDCIIFCDDTGFGIEQLNDSPGFFFPRALIKFYLDFLMAPFLQNGLSKSEAMHFANEKIVNQFKGKKALIETSFGIFLKKSCVLSSMMDGHIVDEYKQFKNGYAFDLIFIPNNYSKTLAELVNANEIDKPRNILVKQLCNCLQHKKITRTKSFNVVDESPLYLTL